LLGLLYAGVIQSLVSQWWHDPNYGHGFFVPVFSCLILWLERKRWTKAESIRAISGL